MPTPQDLALTNRCRRAARSELTKEELQELRDELEHQLKMLEVGEAVDALVDGIELEGDWF